jgi:ribulose-5-phosphate 4-epimerase/fuculose-1-phosphate aldolase
MHLVSTKGWSPGSSANISVRVPGTNHVCIKSTGASMTFGAMDPESSVVVIDLDGSQVDGVRKPSMEFRFHLGIYNVRPDVGAVLHAHSPYATAYAVANQELPMVSAPARLILKKVPLLAYAPPGSQELANIVTRTFSDRTVLSALLGGHGVVAVGADIYEAFKYVDWTEDAIEGILEDCYSPRLIPGFLCIAYLGRRLLRDVFDLRFVLRDLEWLPYHGCSRRLQSADRYV